MISSEVTAAEVVTLSSATTVEGSSISIRIEDGVVTLNDSITVIATDIDASNGVIHLIDGVLIP